MAFLRGTPTLQVWLVLSPHSGRSDSTLVLGLLNSQSPSDLKQHFLKEAHLALPKISSSPALCPP